VKYLYPQDEPTYRFTEEEVTEQAMTLMLGALDQIPPERRQEWLLDFVKMLNLIADPDQVLEELGS